MSAILQPVRQLTRGCGLAGTLESGHQDHGRRLRGKFHPRGVVSERLDQLVADNLDDLLAWRKSCENFLADSFGLDAVDQLLDDFEVDVGFKQRQANLAQRLRNVLFGELGLSAKALERSLQFFLKILEHSLSRVYITSGRLRIMGPEVA